MSYDNDSWLVVWLDDGSLARVLLEYEQTIDAAVERYWSSQQTRNTILDLTCASSGAPLRYLASSVVGWVQSTPEFRQAEWDHEGARKKEEKEQKIAAGIFDDD